MFFFFLQSKAVILTCILIIIFVAESNSRIDKDAAARFIKHAIGSQAPPDDVKKPDPEALLRKYAGNKWKNNTKTYKWI